MNRRAPLLVLVGVLPGCSLFGTTPPDIIIDEKPVPIVCSATTERPDELNLGDTPPTLVMNDAQVWGYWFNSELYAVLAENLQSMRTWMTQSSAIRGKLVECIDGHNDRLEAEDPPE